MLEFVESVPFYGRMGREQVGVAPLGSTRKVQCWAHFRDIPIPLTQSYIICINISNVYSLLSPPETMQELFILRQGDLMERLVLRNPFPLVSLRWSDVPRFPFRLCAIAPYDGIHSGGSAFSAAPLAFCWVMDFMLLAARVARYEQMRGLVAVGNLFGLVLLS